MKLYYTKGNLFRTITGKMYIGYYHTYGSDFYRGKKQTAKIQKDLKSYQLIPFFEKRALLETIVDIDDSAGSMFTHDFDPSRGINDTSNTAVG